MSKRDPVKFQFSTLPANSGTVYPLDSTCRTIAAPTAAPGVYRKHWGGAIVRGTIKNGNQAVTLYEEVLTGNAGTSADWETETGGTISIAASSTTPVEWKPSAPDFRLRLVAGGTAPDSLVCNLEVLWDQDFGT